MDTLRYTYYHASQTRCLYLLHASRLLQIQMQLEKGNDLSNLGQTQQNAHATNNDIIRSCWYLSLTLHCLLHNNKLMLYTDVHCKYMYSHSVFTFIPLHVEICSPQKTPYINTRLNYMYNSLHCPQHKILWTNLM